MLGWQDFRGQLFLGSEDFLRQMQARIETLEKGSVQLSRAVRMPNRPTTTQIVNKVAETFGLPAEEVFNRKLNKEGFQVLVYLPRAQPATQGSRCYGRNLLHTSLANPKTF